MRVYTTVRYLVVQFDARQKPFVAFGNVPFAVIATNEISARQRTSAGLPFGGTADRLQDDQS